MKNIVYKRFLLIIIGLFISSLSIAQQYADNWLFGEFGLKFQSNSVTVKVGYAPHQNRGMGIISDKDGELLFYSDGFSIWNKNHVLMPNGNSLISFTSSPATHESLIIPKPGSETIYYLFTVNPYNGSSSSGLYYSIIDLSLNNGLGDVVLKGNKILNEVSNRITAVYHQNRQDVWLIVQKANSNNYYSFLLSSNGLSDMPVISTGSSTSVFSQGQLKASPDGNKIASTYYYGFDLFDFNNSSGQLSNLMSFTSPISYRGFYGIEFSSDATRLFVHLDGSIGESGIYQYDVSKESYDQINNSRSLIFKETHSSIRDMQLAPNGKIYATKSNVYGGTGYLEVIENPNEYGKNCKVSEDGFYLEGKATTSDNTPNFIQNYFFKTSFDVNSTCQGSFTEFHVTNESFLDSVRWDFGEGSSASALHAQFKYTKAGDYQVRLLAFYPEKTDTIIKTITINPSPEINLGHDMSVCYGHELSVADGFTSYLWNTGERNRSIVIKESGNYKLTVSNSFGCMLTDSVYLTVTDLPVVNVPDSIKIGTLDSIAVNPGKFKSYKWSTGQTTPLIYVKKEGWYSVTVENETGCSATKSFYAYINSSQNNVNPNDWEILNPLPSPLPALDVCFLNSQIGFIINNNQIIGTSDGGNHWKVMKDIPSGRRMAFKDNIGYVIGNEGAIYKSTYMGSGWNKLNVSFTDQLNAISLISKDTVMITSDTKLFVSVDGGQTWKSSFVNSVNIKDSYFISSKVGHIVCSNGTIMKTVDGGAKWYITSSGSYYSSDNKRIYFMDSSIGFVSRGYHDVLKTSDGGETWVNITTITEKIYSFCFLNRQTGYIAGENGVIYKTTDGGTAWNWIGFQTDRTWGNDINSIYFIDSMTGFAVGMNGRIMKTMDGGKTWNQYSITYNTIKKLKFITNQTAVGLVDNSLIKTIDGGKNWSFVTAPVLNGNIVQFDFVTENVGYCIAGGNSNSSANIVKVYKTTDGGKTWMETNNTPNLFSDNLYSIDFMDPLNGYVSGGYNMKATFKTVDGGITWQQVNTLSFLQIQFVNQQVGYARDAYKRIFKTSDAGKTWKISFEADNQIQSFHFLDENTGYFVGVNSANYKTVDGGTSWQKLGLPYSSYNDVRFFNSNVGYVSEGNGIIYQTNNGGLSWETLEKPYNLTCIEIFDKNLFIYGSNGVILKKLIEFNPVTLVMNALSTITNNIVTLTGNIASNEGMITDIKFEYGETSFTNSISAEPDSIRPHTNSDVSAILMDLKPTTSYSYRLTANFNGVTYTSKTFQFTTLKDYEVIMNYVFPVTSNEAGLSGQIISNRDDISNIEFQYGTNYNFDFSIAASQKAVAGGTRENISGQLVSLKPQTYYLVRIKATYNGKVIYSEPIDFITPAAYEINFFEPTFSGNNINLGAYVCALKDTIRNLVWEYGTTREYNNTIASDISQVDKNSFAYIKAQAVNLNTTTIYYYRLRFELGGETVYSNENIVRFGRGVMIVPTDIEKLTDSSIILNGLTNPNGKDLTNIQFQYGITTAYGDSVYASPKDYTGFGTKSFQATLNNLLPGTEYHFRIKANYRSTKYYSQDFTYSTRTTSVIDINNNSALVVVYPNPAHENVFLKSSTTILRLEFLNMNGRILDVKTRVNSFNITNYPNGLYFLKVYTDKGLEIKKIIKD